MYKKEHTLIKNISLLKTGNHQLGLQWVVISNIKDHGSPYQILWELSKCDTERKGENAVGKLVPKDLLNIRVTTDLQFV